MTPGASFDPIALERDEGEALWFLGTLSIIKASAETTGGRMGLIYTLAPRGAGAPPHVHHREDEWFYVIEGELTFMVGGETIVAPAGAFVYGPREIPHAFEVTSDEARFLLGAEPAGFERFVRAVGEPAPELTIPPPADGPPDLEALTAAAAEYDIEIFAPPADAA
jgi:quercetin dioxygenase-like cupin family protein